MEAFRRYLYDDDLDSETEPEAAVEVVRVAQYYGAPRLTGLAEQVLLKLLHPASSSEQGTVAIVFRVVAFFERSTFVPFFFSGFWTDGIQGIRTSYIPSIACSFLHKICTPGLRS